jgi:predicted dienelactone hydrolase
MNLAKVLFRLLGLLFIPLFLVSCTAISSFAVKPTPTFAFTAVVEPTVKVEGMIPTYARPGAYNVARITTEILNGSDEIKTYIWYPANVNGTPNIASGPYPLVVFAPGGYLDGMAHILLLHHLASYGMVTVSWNPRNETDSPDYYKYSSYRPLDMKSIIDELEKMTASNGQLAGLIDMKQVVAAGYSQGGGTALMLGGAQRSFEWCKVHSDLQIIDYEVQLFCGGFPQHQEEIAKMAGLKAVPEGLWPPQGDPRIVALVAMAPLGKYWGANYEGVSAVKVPALILVGSADDVIKPELGANSVYKQLGSPKKTLVDFEGKDHFYFTVVPQVDSSGYPLFHITTAFLLAELKGDDQAAKTLSSANTSFPGVKIETTEFK